MIRPQLRRMVAGFASRADRHRQSAETMSKFARHANPMYGISEHDTYWRVHLQRNGKRFTATFSCLKCGGREQALTLSAAWRDQVVRDHPQLEHRELAQRVRRNNTSGIAEILCRRGGRCPACAVDGQYAHGPRGGQSEELLRHEIRR